MKYINKITGPYDVNSFAVNAAIAALKDTEYINNYVRKVKEARSWILEKFRDTNIRSHFCGGNYFLIWPNNDPKTVEELMKKEGILIRNMGNKKNIQNSLRISIGTKDQMQTFWNSYKKIDL